MTWHQLEDAQKAIVQGHSDRNVSAMLKGGCCEHAHLE